MVDTTSGAPVAASRTWSVRRVFAVALLGCLVVQAAWIVATGAFSGPDEHEHAYRAGAVAHGDFARTHPQAYGGWGEVVRTPRDLAEAGRDACESLLYIPVTNCVVGRADADGLVAVGSSASRYNPVYYVVVGTVGRLGSGLTSFYAMRAGSALLCALLIAAAVATTSTWARTAWPTVALLLAATPTLWFTTALVAPNGVEVAGAVLTWSALLTVASRHRRGAAPGRALLLAATGAVPLVTARTIGPLWCVLIVVAVALLLGPGGLRTVLRNRWTVPSAVLVLGFAALAVGWSWLAQPNSLPGPGPRIGSAPATTVAREWVLWFLQSISAVPARNVANPAGVYAIFLAGWLALCVLAWRRATWRERSSAGWVVVMSTAVPVTVTVVMYPAYGTLWQGRYGYPLSLGVLLVCGVVLDRRPPTTGRWLVPSAVVATAGASAWALVSMRHYPFAVTPGEPAPWLTTPPAVLVVLVVVGTTLLAWAGAQAGVSGAADAATHRESAAAPAPLSMASPARTNPRASASSGSVSGSS